MTAVHHIGERVGWTDERIEQLKALHKLGLTANQIAKQIGYCTRNAVIGKARRLGLGPIGGGKACKPQVQRLMVRPVKRREPAPAKASKSLGPLAHNMARKAATVDPGLAEPSPEAPGAATILTLSSRTCRWPIGDPRDDGFTFCGCRPREGSVYCARHASVAYAPPNPRSSAKELARMFRRYA